MHFRGNTTQLISLSASATAGNPSARKSTATATDEENNADKPVSVMAATTKKHNQKGNRNFKESQRSYAS